MYRTRTMVMLVAFAIVIAGCGDDATQSTDAGTATTTTAAPTTSSATTTSAVNPTAAPTTSPAASIAVTSDAGSVALPGPAQRIAALSATHVEMLFAMGAGEQVIAGDLFSNYPPEAADLLLVDSFNLNVEAVIELDPDLVILSFDPGDAVAAFEAVGIPTLLYVGAASLDDVYFQFGELGKASGHEMEAETVVAQMQEDLDAIAAEVGDAARGVTYYHETDPFSFYTPNSSSFVGQLYGLFGLVNIADAATDEFGTGYPQLAPEFIIESNPDVIFLGAFGETAETVAARDGWATMSAVAAGRVVPVGVDESSRWGPRIIDFFREVADAVLTLEPVGG